MAKAALPEPQSPGVDPHPRREPVWYRRPPEPQGRVALVGRPADGPLPSEGIHGDEWGAYSALDTFYGDGTGDGLQGASPTARESSE